MTKQELRKQIKESLIQNKASLKEYSNIICNHILESELYSQADTILAYMALSDEVDLQLLINAALQNGKKVFLPKVDPQSPHMEFYEYKKDAKTNQGAFGIMEPEKSAPYAASGHSPAQTLVLVPGRGFTASGARLGRGKAYYDTYFNSLAGKVTLMGVCFNLQLLAELPTEPHDVFMNYVVTENGIINTGR